MIKRVKFIGVLLASLVILLAANSTEKYFEIAKNLDIFATLFKEVNAYYVDEIDPTEMVETGIEAMLKSLDPYTNYIPEEEIESFRTMTTGQYAGIGASISRLPDGVYITNLFEGFSAHKGGIQVGDKLLSVNDVKLDKENADKVSDLLKGRPGTEVKVRVQRYGQDQPLSFDLERENIRVGNVPYYGKITESIGYIKLEDFTEGAYREVKSAVNDLLEQGSSGLVLDLRGNPGGLLNEAVNISNIFIPKGKDVVSTLGKITEWNKTYKALNAPIDTEVPLVILIDGNSASASEIVSGVIQDYDRGVLIGRNTFGKGLVQTTRPLTYNAQLKVTTAKYYIPSGRCIQAIDYTHRENNGSSGKVADSLKIKYVTSKGRPVYDQGGLAPDIKVPVQNYSTISTTLLLKGLIFQYANEYYFKNGPLTSARDFEFSEKDYSLFTQWLSSKDYSYDTQVEHSIEELIVAAKSDRYYGDIANEIASLKSNVKKSKEQDLVTFKTEITHLLEEEIANRYYNYKGEIEAGFKHDQDITEAINLLSDQEKYGALLR